MQSTFLRGGAPHDHVAVIMDGSGRWAERRGRPRTEGHEAGARAVHRIASAAPGFGVTTLTLFAFSTENWRRPPEEVAGLMRVFGRFFESARRGDLGEGVRVSVLGRKDRIPMAVLDRIHDAERATRLGDRLHLRIGIDFSGREEIHRAALTLAESPGREFDRFAGLITGGEEPDILVRTGGMVRLSDFLVWEAAHAELYFTPVLWPDFGPADLMAALEEVHGRTGAAAASVTG